MNVSDAEAQEVEAEANQSDDGGFLGFVHGALDAASYVPIIGDVPQATDGMLYAFEGNYSAAGADAAGLAIGLIPVPGLNKLGKAAAEGLLKEVGDHGVAKISAQQAKGIASVAGKAAEDGANTAAQNLGRNLADGSRKDRC